MLDMTAEAIASLKRGNQKRHLRVESWYSDQLLHDDIPVDTGSEEVDRGDNVPERITLTVPARDRGDDFTPSSLLSPLAANGQVLKISIGLELAFSNIEWLTRGYYVVTRSVRRGSRVDVEAAGLLWKIQEARLVSPLQPTGTFKSLIRDLVEPALTVDFDAALSDRAVPSNINYDEDRLGALNSVLAAWPASAEVNAEGYLYVTTVADPTSSVLDLTAATSGTIIERSGVSTREGVYNAVVAQGQTSDGNVVRGVAYDLNGPKRSGGPFNELPVPLYFDSPLLTTQAQANTAAASRLKTLKRQTSLTYDIEMVPHPGLQVGDGVSVEGQLCSVEGYRLPLTAGGGAQSLKARVI